MIFYTFRFPLPIFPCVICHTFQNTDEQVFRNDFIVFLLWISCLSLLGLTNASNCDFSCHHDHHPASTELSVVIKQEMDVFCIYIASSSWIFLLKFTEWKRSALLNLNKIVNIDGFIPKSHLFRRFFNWIHAWKMYLLTIFDITSLFDVVYVDGVEK